MIAGARVDVRLTFDWIKKESTGNFSGNGEALLISDKIGYEKKIVDINKYVYYYLYHYFNVTFES